VKARQEAGGRRQEENYYGIKTGFSIITGFVDVIKTLGEEFLPSWFLSPCLHSS